MKPCPVAKFIYEYITYVSMIDSMNVKTRIHCAHLYNNSIVQFNAEKLHEIEAILYEFYPLPLSLLHIMEFINSSLSLLAANFVVFR